jgi:hypothetical protein
MPAGDRFAGRRDLAVAISPVQPRIHVDESLCGENRKYAEAGQEQNFRLLLRLFLA